MPNSKLGRIRLKGWSSGIYPDVLNRPSPYDLRLHIKVKTFHIFPLRTVSAAMNDEKIREAESYRSSSSSYAMSLTVIGILVTASAAMFAQMFNNQASPELRPLNDMAVMMFGYGMLLGTIALISCYHRRKSITNVDIDEINARNNLDYVSLNVSRADLEYLIGLVKHIFRMMSAFVTFGILTTIVIFILDYLQPPYEFCTFVEWTLLGLFLGSLVTMSIIKMRSRSMHNWRYAWLW